MDGVASKKTKQLTSLTVEDSKDIRNDGCSFVSSDIMKVMIYNQDFDSIFLIETNEDCQYDNNSRTITTSFTDLSVNLNNDYTVKPL